MTTCLIVDPSPVVRRVLRRMLESLGLAVEEAADSAAALAACRDNPPAAVVLDSAERAGLALLRDLRALPEIAQPVVLFCPTEGELSQLREALELGATEVLARPFDRAMLRAKLDMAGVLPPGAAARP